jgi:hypothetical protein
MRKSIYHKIFYIALAIILIFAILVFLEYWRMNRGGTRKLEVKYTK